MFSSQKASLVHLGFPLPNPISRFPFNSWYFRLHNILRANIQVFVAVAQSPSPYLVLQHCLQEALGTEHQAFLYSCLTCISPKAYARPVLDRLLGQIHPRMECIINYGQPSYSFLSFFIYLHNQLLYHLYESESSITIDLIQKILFFYSSAQTSKCSLLVTVGSATVGSWWLEYSRC